MKQQGRLGDTWHIDEVFVTIQGERYYLWRAVGQDGDTIDILVQRRRNKKAAERFFRRLLKGQGGEPRWLVTDKLRSYDAAHRTIMPTVDHINPITGLKSRTNPRASVNAPCVDFPPRLRLNDFSHSTGSPRISFALAAT